MKRIITLFIFMLSIQSIFSQAPTNGLVAYYPFNGNAQDESGNGNHGTVNGATLTTDRFGNSGRAFSFDGVSNNILVNNSNSLQNINEITLSAWVYYTGLASDGTIPILDKSNSSIGGQYFLRIYNNGNNSFSGTLNGNHGGLSFNGIQPQTWHLLTMVSANNNFKFYLDGQLIGAVNGSGTSFSNTLPLTIGANPSGILEVLNGKLDDIRIYNRALSDAEVSQIYYSEYNPTPPTTGLVAYFPFNNNTNDEHLALNPSATTINNGTVYGATPTTDRFGNCDKAYNFNGTSDYIQLNSNIGIVNELTVSAWVKTEQPSTNINAIVSTNNDTGFHFQISDNPSVNIVSYNNSNNFNVTLPIIPITPSQVWRHLIVVYKSGESKIYENGIQIGFSNDLFSSIEILNNLFIGSGYLNQRFFNGKLDDIRIYNQALTQQQVTDLYNAEKPSNAGTNSEAGITVLVHGFQGEGGTVDNTFAFTTMGHDILQRAGGGIMYKNNNETGLLEPIEGTYDPNKEIVLVYDWKELSRKGIQAPILQNNFSGNGYLEAASDNLFATILKLSHPTNSPMSFSLQQFLNKPKHFIGHSRGGVLLLQLAHRFANYFPNASIEQATFLDPHPATAFGDLVGTYTIVPLIVSPPNLPGVYGSATNCSITGCYNTTADLKIPFNIKKADEYFRKDGEFEGLFDFSDATVGSFDGLPMPTLGDFSREINNSVLNSGSPTVGGTHSGVHLWYRGTIDTSLNIAGSNTDNWYINASQGMTNNFMLNECRTSTGFAYSRIGGKYNQLPLISESHKISLLDLNRANAERNGFGNTTPEYQNGLPISSVFNGNFHFNNDAGWIKNGGTTENFVAISNEKAIINQSISNGKSYLKHSIMYFGGISENFKYLKLDVKKHNNDTNGKGVIKFHNQNNYDIESYTFDLSILSDIWKTIYIPIPNELLPNYSSDGNIGSFSVYGFDNSSSSFEVDNFELISCTPISNNLYVAMPDPSTLNFADIDNDHWAKEGIYKSRNYGLFRGTSNTTFTPNTSLTKAEAITVLVRAGIKLGVIPTYNTTGLPYADVTSCNQYFPYIQTAKNLGHLEFTSNFNPNSPITVAQLCVYMDKILQINLHDWNATTPNTPWVLAPTSQYIQSQLSQIVINQPEPEQNAAMRRILHCIDVVKNDNIIDSYRTQNVWTLKDVENINISSGQTVEVDGTATVTRARMAVASANLFRFVFKKLNNGNAPAGRMANTMNTTNSDPSIDDFIGIGNTFDNKDIPATDTPEAPTQITFNINSGDTLGLQYQSDTDTAGNPQFFYWSMNKNVDSNIANLVSVPINSIQNHRKVNFVAPVVSAPKTWYLYSYLANNKGKIKETVITINVSSTLSTGEVNGILDNVKIYPNPADNILFIDTIDNQIQKIEIFDLQGRLLKTIKENKEKYQIDISNFSSATYLVKLSTEKGSQTVKVVKK